MAKIAVVDDDPLVGDLTRVLLAEAGHEVTIIDDSREALAKLKDLKPEVALLDILMPGIDGLTLCRQIREDPELKAMKVAMVSAKSFETEREKALRVGADTFIQKPYKVGLFPGQIQALLDGSAVPGEQIPAVAAPGFSEPAQAKLDVRVWGFRSLSAHSVGGRNSRYGYRTSCVSVQCGERLFIFDAGSGIEALGTDLSSREPPPREAWLLLSHFHQDHVEGLGAFACVRQEGFALNLCGANDPEKSLQDLATEAFEKTLPGAEPVRARIQLFELQEETYEMLPEVKLTPFYANHPSTTLGFILETEGRKVVYCPDSEIYGEGVTALQDYDERLANLCQDADLLIHDARYTDADYYNRKNGGHSSFVSTVNLAGRAGVKRLVLFHLDDAYTDALLDDVAAQAQALAAQQGFALECAVAREGLTIKL